MTAVLQGALLALTASRGVRTVIAAVLVTVDHDARASTIWHLLMCLFYGSLLAVAGVVL